jgi:hypothetical protein
VTQKSVVFDTQTVLDVVQPRASDGCAQLPRSEPGRCIMIQVTVESVMERGGDVEIVVGRDCPMSIVLP